jgi:hypothetical protein
MKYKRLNMKESTKIRGKQLLKHLMATIPIIKEFFDLISNNVRIATESKIELLINYLMEDEENTIQELLEETKYNEEAKAIATHIIEKTILSSELDEIKIFLLAKIYLYYATKKDDKQLYIYQNLLTTTDYLTENDYHLIYEIEKNKKQYFNENKKYIEDYIKNILEKKETVIIPYINNDKYTFIYSSLSRSTEAKVFMQKMLSLGYFSTLSVGLILNEVKDNYYRSYGFELNNTYEILAQYIQEYFLKYREN